jgi:vancomycin resistance protein YoaR
MTVHIIKTKMKAKDLLEEILSYLFFGIAILFIVLGITLLILDFGFAEKYFPRTKISGESVSFKSQEEVKNDFYQKLNIFNEGITFSAPNYSKKVRPEDIGIEIYLDDTLGQSFYCGRDILTFAGIREKLSLLLLGKNFSLDYLINKEKFDNFVKSELEPLGVISPDIHFKKKGDNLEIVLGKEGKSLDKEKLRSRISLKINSFSVESIEVPFISLLHQVSRSDLKQAKKDIKQIIAGKLVLNFEDKTWEISENELRDWIVFNLFDEEVGDGFYKKKFFIDFDREKAGKFLGTIALEINIKPKNARFGMNEGKFELLEEAHVGRELLIDANFEELKTKAKSNDRQVALKVIERGAEVTQENVDALGIKELVGSGASNFAGSPRNRVHNIKIAAEKLNGILVKPGETFSLVENIGEVNAEAGYLPELVIKENKTIPEFGGGLCQIATTVFRAAIYTGLNVTERQSHSYAVSYYNPQGMDATVYIPHPDLRFINDTQSYILIQIKISSSNLTLDFYGTKDGREVKIEGPTFWDRKSDGSFRAHFSQIVKMSDGTERKDSFSSFYDSPAKYPRN